MKINADEFKSTQIKAMQNELNLRSQIIDRLKVQIESERADHRVIFVCWIITLILYFFR